MNRFPNLPGSVPGYPGDGRNVYEQIEGSFDYTLWKSGARLTLLSVPWGVYDAATMTDRPGFDTDAERDEWFARYIADEAHISEAHTLDTVVRYQMREYVKVPFTFDVAARYNYLIIDYPDAPVAKSTGGIRRWFFHITDIQYNAPSSTSLYLVPDWWVTVAPSMSISHMILARGHAPVIDSPVDEYLSDPLANCGMLLAPDDDFASGKRVASSETDVLNSGQMYAVICTKGVIASESFAGYKMPFDAATFNMGVPTDWQFGCRVEDLKAVLLYIEKNASQMIQSIDGVFFASEKLIVFNETFKLGSITCYIAPVERKRTVSLHLERDAFGYDERIAHLAKLYTSPYAHIEITDGTGAVKRIEIENINGDSARVDCVLNFAYPWLKVSAHAVGIGGSPETLTFKAIDSRDFAGGGAWYDTLMSWDVPCFRVLQSSESRTRTSQHFSREQAKADANTAYANQTASIATARQNAANSAGNVTANNSASVSASAAITARSNRASADGANEGNQKIIADSQADRAMSSAAYDADKDGLSVASNNNDAQAAAAAGGIIASAAVGAATGAAAGGVGAIPGAVLGAGVGLVTTGVNWANSQASNAVSQSNNDAMYAAAVNNALTKSTNATLYANTATGISTAAQTDNTATANNAQTTIAGNNAGLINTNAQNTANTENANAQRTRDNSLAAVENQIKEAALQQPLAFGDAKNGEFANTRPMALSINIVTESDAAIRQAAAQFLRYGYRLGQVYDFTTWNKCRNFTYWQVSDVWATGVDAVPEEGQDAVRRMLYDGVTCWRDPEKIGKVSVYDNY